MSNCCNNDEKKSAGLTIGAMPSKEELEAPLTTPCCDKLKTKIQENLIPDSELNKTAYFAKGLAIAIVWFAVYSAIVPAANFITFDLFNLEAGSELALAVEFFIYDTAKILLLLVFMVYLIAWLRAGMNTEKIRDFLAGKARGVGYFVGGFFGAVTPFCSCSSVPLFIAFTNARIPIGITMSFLITSPLINEVAVVLLWGLLGWKFTLVYVGVGILAGVIAGTVMDLLKADRWLQDFLLESMKAKPMMSLSLKGGTQKISLMQRHYFAKDEMLKIAKQVWKWVVIGVGLGAVLHGYVPQEWFEEHLSAGQWWSVPLAVGAGIPLYTNVTGIIPIMESLLLKGLPAGTTLAFCMSAVGASLPEILMLKQVMKWKLLALFVVILLIIFTIVGWIFNYTQNLLI